MHISSFIKVRISNVNDSNIMQLLDFVQRTRKTTKNIIVSQARGRGPGWVKGFALSEVDHLLPAVTNLYHFQV